MSKFGGLAANVAKPYRVELIDPVSAEPITDKKGKAAFIDILSTDSAEGRAFEAAGRRKMTEKAVSGSDDIPDQFDHNIAKAARLTRDWYLVDPSTREPIDVPCSVDNAAELYGEPGMTWLFSQVWAGATRTANFMQRPARP